MNVNKKYIFPCFSLILLLAVGFFSSCSDDFVIPDGGEKDIDKDGFSLGINIALDKASTRAGEEDIDNYIDTQDKLRLLFFDANGQFIFEAIDRTVMERPSASTTQSEWFVHIPVNYIVDFRGRQYDIEKLKQQLKTKDFKVAVLANWPGGEPLWGLDESIFGAGGYNNAKNINDLHHLKDDSNYTNDARFPTYSFFMEGNKMGVKQDWVRSRIVTSREKAEEWIRSNWNPQYSTSYQYAQSTSYYKSLWQIYNFHAAYTGSTAGFDDVKTGITYNGTNAFKTEWARKNNNELYSFVANPRTFNWKETNNTGVYYDYTETGLSYCGTATRVTGVNGQTAIQIPSGTGGQSSPDTEANNAFHFNFFGTGRINVKWASARNGTTARLNFERRNNRMADSNNPYLPNRSGNADASTNKSTSSTTPIWSQWNVSVTGDSQYVTIFSSTGNAVIYEIEYIEEKYLYDTDREAILPSYDNPIPMYGVQNYSALGNWEKGTTFSLEQDIVLIRSIAKIELYIPTSYNYGQAPTHVLMRSMNRTGWLEPVDVETPTSITWVKNDNHSTTNGNGCEWYTIQKHGPFYGQGDNVATAQRLISWFYGSWKTAKWKTTDGSTFSGWNFGSVTVPAATTASPYPRIFNPSVDRSDYCNMIKVESDRAGYYKYLLYMPDKNIDDSNTVGNVNDTPKVAHIEFRYSNHDDSNLDDNNCHRIYFTDYNTNSTIKNQTASGFDSYEPTNLGQHWPVMRNHIYTFTVTGTRSGNTPAVISEAKTWDGHKLNEIH